VDRPNVSSEVLEVAVDATPLLDRPTGVGVVTRALLERLAHAPDVHPVAFSVSWSGRGRLPEVVPDGVDTTSRPMAARPLRAAWRRAGWPPIELWTGPVDVVHGPNFVVPPARRAARLVTIHDLTAIRYPELCTADVLQWPDLLRRALADGAWVHTVSQAMADEIADAFAVPAERLVVVHNGVDDVPPAAEGLGRRLARHDRYVLALGTLEPRKDIPALVRAFDAVAAADPDLGLVLAGADGWGIEKVNAAIDAAAHRDRIVRTGWVGGEDRAGLLREAAVLAYPSRYEGFGLPPLEAMSVGVPVVGTAVGALLEVVGDAADLVPLDDDEALAAALTRVLGDEAHRADLVVRGRARAAGYSWYRCADGLLDLYRRLAAGGSDPAP
jgi:glycosyltransferase involved in cell wall biosynthesis